MFKEATPCYAAKRIECDIKRGTGKAPSGIPAVSSRKGTFERKFGFSSIRKIYPSYIRARKFPMWKVPAL